jgi:hypothetical protein
MIGAVMKTTMVARYRGNSSQCEYDFIAKDVST